MIGVSHMVWEYDTSVILPTGEQVPVWVQEYGVIDKDGNQIREALEKDTQTTGTGPR